MTIEAALILPFFVMTAVFFFGFFHLMAVQIRLQSAMEKTGREMAAVYYAVQEVKGTENEESVLEALGESAAIPVIADRLILNEVLEESGSLGGETLISGGEEGISFLGSSFDEDEETLCLKASYKVKLPFVSFFGLTIRVSQQSVHRVWSGKESENATDEEVVYITQTGEVYHTDLSCTYLHLSIREVTEAELPALTNASGSSYTACELCKDRASAGILYVTTYGDRYHTDRNCSGLKRTVLSIPLSQAGDRRICSKCERRDDS